MTDELSQLRRERDDLRESLAAQERSAALRDAVRVDDLSKLGMRYLALREQLANAAQNYRRECAKVVQLAAALKSTRHMASLMRATTRAEWDEKEMDRVFREALEVLTLVEIPF